jgi:XFP C-terminal domain
VPARICTSEVRNHIFQSPKRAYA